jgi:hypothetical protein
MLGSSYYCGPEPIHLLFIFYIVFVFEAVQTKCLTGSIIGIELFVCLSSRHVRSGGIAPQNLTSFLVGEEWSASCSDTFCLGKGLLLTC